MFHSRPHGNIFGFQAIALLFTMALKWDGNSARYDAIALK